MRIGSARHDENGKLTGGRPGDQTGTEVSMQNFYVHKNSGAGETLLFNKGMLLQIPAFAITKSSLEKIINLNAFEDYNKIPAFKIGEKVKLKKDMKGLDDDILEEYGGREVTLNFFDERDGKINFDENKSSEAFYIIDIENE